MISNCRQLLGRARARIRNDLRTDPYLIYLLVLAAVLSGFWLWYRVPNFRSPDEFTRLLDSFGPLVSLVADPSLSTLQEGVTHGRALGTTFYLYGLVAVTMVVVALVTGEFDTLASLPSLGSRWAVWHALPAWFWTMSILLARLLNLLFAVGCVYLVYRLGTALRDRATGRLATLLLVLSFGFLRSAHEYGEDIPALFLMLLVLYLAVRYVETNRKQDFLAGCAVGGIAIATKFTAGVVVPVLGCSYLLRARKKSSWDRTNIDEWRAMLSEDSRLLRMGATFGVVAVVIGFPSMLVGGPIEFGVRLLAQSAGKYLSGNPRVSDLPIWTLLYRQYRRGLGLPLLVAAGGGVAVSLSRLRGRSSETNATILVVVALLVYALAFSGWQYIKVHHLLPTFPLLLVLTAAALSRLRTHAPVLGRVVVVVLVLTTGVYAAGGLLQYPTAPRDQATKWITTEVPEGTTMEVYSYSVTDVAIPHERKPSHYISPKVEAFDRMDHNKARFLSWQSNVTDRNPDYIELIGRDLNHVRLSWSLPADIHIDLDNYTRIARFTPYTPPDPVMAIGKGTYPRVTKTVVILERSDRCPESPTCSTNVTTGDGRREK